MAATVATPTRMATAKGWITRSTTSWSESTSWTTPRHQVAAAEGGQAGGRQRLEAPVDVHAEVGEHAEGGVVTDQALAVAEEAARQPEELDADDGQRQRGLGRVLRGAREISQADVPMRAMTAPIAPAPSREAASQARGGRRGRSPRVRPDRHAASLDLMPAPRAGGAGRPGRPGRAAHGRWATIRAVRPPPAADRRQHVLLGPAVEAGGRLVEQEQRARRARRPGPGTPVGARRPRGRRRPRRASVSRPSGEPRAPRRSSPAASSAAADLVVGGIGSARAGRCRRPTARRGAAAGEPRRSCRRQSARSSVGQIDPPERDRPASAEPSRGCTESRVDFAASARARAAPRSRPARPSARARAGPAAGGPG